jgi:chromosome segregation ATPase
MSDLTPDIGQGGVLGAIATAITIAATVGYKAYRKVTEDKTCDRQVARQEDFVEDLMKANATLAARMETLEKRADTFAAERNFALGQESVLKGKVQLLEGRIADLAEARESAKRLTEQLGRQIDKLREENVALRKHVEVLEDIIRKGGGGSTPPRPEMDIPLKWEDPAP